MPIGSDAGRLDAGAIMAGDPTGLSSPVGRLVVLAGLLAVLVVLLIQWRRRR